MEKMRIAHISDIHFAKVTLSLSQFFSKRWIGNANLLLFRKRVFEPQLLEVLRDFLLEKEVNLVLITGDVSTTSLKEEFALAKRFVSSLEALGMRVIVIPGNHDHYTTKAWKKKVYYDYFGAPISPLGLSLKNDGVTTVDLEHDWVLVALDTAIATSWSSSRGYFSESIEQKLKMSLESIPMDKQVLVVNHFPLFNNERENKALQRGDALVALLKQFPRVRLYCHGHTHRQCIADLTSSSLPIILDSGSVVDVKKSSFHLIDLAPYQASVHAYTRKVSLEQSWQVDQSIRWDFRERSLV